MTREDVKSTVQKVLGDRVTPLEGGKYDPLFEVKPDQLLDIMQQFRDHDELAFDYLCNLGGVDTGEHFEVIYQLASVAGRKRVDLKVTLPYEKAEIESVKDVWPAANWYEREMWELYGINVLNHGKLERFLLPEDWDQGFPMRRDWSAPDFIRLPEL